MQKEFLNVFKESPIREFFQKQEEFLFKCMQREKFACNTKRAYKQAELN